jgi:VIT1/CCC1 family predicted Fe2+/Mn2+ transporter
MALGRFPTLTGHMYSDVLYSFTIGFVGAILFLLVDKLSPKALWPVYCLFVAGLAILHKLQPYGLALF